VALQLPAEDMTLRLGQLLTGLTHAVGREHAVSFLQGCTRITSALQHPEKAVERVTGVAR
jgi:hypothetical protein